MNVNLRKSARGSRGQSLVETALMLPLLIMIVLNVVNLGYFFLVVINLTGAARTASLYAIQGSSTPAASQLPNPGSASTIGSVTYLTFQDMTGALWNPTSASVQVCTEVNITGSSGTNGTGSATKSNCVTCTSSSCGAVGTGTPAPNADPEAPTFILNRVDIAYTFNTLIPGTIFNIPLQASAMCNSGTCTFSRHAEMRAME
jgi:Flp pilus assembly protein TadG